MPSTPDFRTEHRRVVAALLRRFGSASLEDALDATQEAMLAALHTWPTHGQPIHPTAWLIRTAERRMVDRHRVTRREVPLEPSLPLGEMGGEELDLYRMVCSPRLNSREQVCLMLRTCAGLTSAEIARLLHESEEAVQRRISRSKEKLCPEDLVAGESWDALLLTLYLIFTEGHEASRGPKAIRWDLALSAMRLAESFAELFPESFPELEALLALMYFHASRFSARENSGPGVPAQGDPAAIQRGFWHLARAQMGTRLTRYHVEAGLAAALARGAPSAEVLEWQRMLADQFPSPMAQLSLALAIGNHEGWAAGLAALESLSDDAVLARMPHYLGALGYAHAELGHGKQAALFYRRAIAAGMSQPNQEAFEQRIARLGLVEPSARE